MAEVERMSSFSQEPIDHKCKLPFCSEKLFFFFSRSFVNQGKSRL